jgi:4,5-dihydroxyphthalate decarboxylase
MAKLTLGFISAFNERVEPLMNGTVKAEGIELIPTYSHPAETFWRQLKFGEFEVAEMSMSSFLIAKSQGADMVALPVFPSRRLFQQHRLRHHQAGRPCRQKTRRCRVSANRGALDSRHLGTRLRCVAI